MKGILLVVIGIMLWACATPSNRQASLDRPVKNLNWSRDLTTVCSEAKLSCGLEKNFGDRFSSDESSDVKSAQVKDLLKDVLRDKPQYEWKIADGVLNVYPAMGDSGTSSALDKIISELRIENMPSNEAAAVVARTAGIPLASGEAFRAVHAKVTLHLQNVTVRQAFNQIVKSDEKAMWEFYRLPDTNNFVLNVYTWGRPTLFMPKP